MVPHKPAANKLPSIIAIIESNQDNKEIDIGVKRGAVINCSSPPPGPAPVAAVCTSVTREQAAGLHWAPEGKEYFSLESLVVGSPTGMLLQLS